MGATYTRQSSYTDGDTITAAHTNDEFNQLLAAFAASTGHTHDGTTAEGGPITKLLGNTLTFGAATAGTDITITFDGESNDGVLKWMEDEDYFEFSDDILIATTEKLQFRDTAIYINSSADGQLDLVADTEIQIAATTVDINGNVDISGTLTIGGAGISEAELEILDGATVTTTEINIMDGDTSASATTVADADRVVFNDAGTMKQVAVTDLAAYFDDEITAMPNLVTTAATTVGALNSGSITSGFGTIDTGSSTITTTGLISGGSLDIDDVLINGTTIGHTDDTDLMTVASGLLTVAGEVSMTTLDIGGTNVTSTAAELNYSDTGAAVGTVVASKVVTADANKDVASFRNITLTGELDAGSLDVSGDADIDGTLEADAITVNGTALNTVIAGVTVTDATNSAHVLVTDNESTNEENLIAFVEDATSSTGNVGLEMDGNFSYNPSTGTVSATIFKGNIDAVDGDFDGTLEADAITLDGTAITTVATLSTGISNGNLPVFTSGAADNDFLRIDGTSIEGRSASEVLSDIAAAPAAGSSNIVTTGALNSGSITSGFGAIDNGSSAITTTGVGSFGSLDISGDIDVDGTANLDAVDIDGAVDIAGNLTVDGGTIKLDGNYPTGSNNVALGNTALDDGSLSGGNNTAIGSAALSSTTSGADNTAVGFNVLSTNQTGSSNTAIGKSALSLNTGGSNVAVGRSALENNSTASNNTAVGKDALIANTTGHSLVAVGDSALKTNTTALANTAVGRAALEATTTGASNTAVGRSALQVNTTGAENVAVGLSALDANTTGSNNVAVGRNALSGNTTAANNTAVGDSALFSNTTGAGNTAVGEGALIANTTGASNIGIGDNALAANTTASANIAIGLNAGDAITTSPANTLVGHNAGSAITTGSGENVCIGNNAGALMTTAAQNVFIGDQAAAGATVTGGTNTIVGDNAGHTLTSGANNAYFGATSGDATTTGGQNVAVGSAALSANTTASNNAAVGFLALAVNTTGTENVAVGAFSLDALTTAQGNIGVGINSGGAVTTGNNNTSLGSAAGSTITTGENNVCVGYNAQPPAADTDHSFTLGDSQITNLRCNDTSISSLSDQRDKTNIVNIPLGLDFINTIRPVSFDWDRRDGTSVGKKDFGFIAQELKVAADATIYADHMRLVCDENPDRLEADPMKMFPILVKSIQELSAKVAELEAKLGE